MSRKARTEKKKEYEELFNKIFGTSINWSRLSIEDLTQLATVLANPDSLCKRLCKEVRHIEDVKSAVSEIRNLLQEIKYEGPLIKVVKKLLGVSTTETPEGGGEGGEAK
jgi:hypothetical protein